MVENFTTTENETYVSDVKEVKMMENDEFEAKLRLKIQSLTIEPRQSVIDSILSYSKSLR